MRAEAQKRAARKWRQSHKHPRSRISSEERRRRKKARYEAKRLELIEYQKRWIKANPEKVQKHRVLGRRERNARKRSTSTGRISYRRILERDMYWCGICGGILDARNICNVHFDHIIPLSKGGTHTEDNIQISHPNCNLRKHASLPT